MSDAINNIESAISDEQQSRMVSPPCPVFTARAITRYDAAISSLTKKRDILQKVLDDQKG